MSVSILAMEQGLHESSAAPPKEKLPKLRAGIDNIAEQMKTDAFNDGLAVGRKEAEDQIKALQEEHKLLLQVLTSKSDMNIKLTNDLQQSRERFKIFENEVRGITQKFHKIIIVNAEFRNKPTTQVAKLQKALEKLKQLTS